MAKSSREDGLILTPEQRRASPELLWVDTASRFLDSKYRIPGTNIRFGADFLLGLFPGAGDLISMGFSGILIATMAKNGASAMLVFRMLMNVAVDTLVGTIPILGNFFDLFYKANRRNVVMMRDYYVAGKHRGSVWPILVGVVVFFVVLFTTTVSVLWWLFSEIRAFLVGT